MFRIIFSNQNVFIHTTTNNNMINYGNSKKYKIEPRVEHEPHEQYIGSTTKLYLSQRLVHHREKTRRRKTGPPPVKRID